MIDCDLNQMFTMITTAWRLIVKAGGQKLFICKVGMSWCNISANWNRMRDDCDCQNIGSSRSAGHLLQNQNLRKKIFFPNNLKMCQCN